MKTHFRIIKKKVFIIFSNVNQAQSSNCSNEILEKNRKIS